MNMNMKTFKHYALILGSMLAVVSVGPQAFAQFTPVQPQQTSMPNMQFAGQVQAGGFSAPPPQVMGEQPAFMSSGNGCSTVRYDNTRMQNGQPMPVQAGGAAHFFGG